MSDKEEIIKKIQDLFNQGKISEHVMKRLIDEVNENLKEEKIEKKFKKIFIESISENIDIIGREDLIGVIFDYGKEGFNVEEKNDTLFIKSKRKSLNINIFGFSTREESLGESLKIFVPKEVDLFINIISGDVNIENVIGEIKVKSVSGNIEVKNALGIIDIYTISGDIDIENINGNFKLNTKSGDINAKRIKNSGFIKSYSGDIEIDDCYLEKGSLSTFSGDISLLNFSLNESVEIKTMSGDIKLITPTKDLDITIDTKTGEGEIIYEGEKTKIIKGKFGFGLKDKFINIKTLSGNYKIEVV